jgi:hypothetical protein
MTSRSLDILCHEENDAIEIAIDREYRAKVRRQAQRYLDEHCDAEGRRITGCMHIHEYAWELGTYRGLMIKAVNVERRARGLKVPEQPRWLNLKRDGAS